jgi:serine/threonine-protein kinase
LTPGTKLKNGTFVVAQELGRGGFGEVYLAKQPRMNRDVAIKVLLPRVAENGEIVARFEREAFAAASLSHPNVLSVFDFDFDGEVGVWFLAMQYVPGGRSLDDILGQPIELAEVARIITAVASGLDAAHNRGIVHRDVKPGNVLLDEDRPLLTDFGIAHLGSMAAITAMGVAVGTPAYMSPEQAMGKPVVPASDQYSLAIMTYEMLAGRPPFLGDALSLVQQQVQAAPPSLANFNPKVNAAARAAITLALSKTPEERYESCSAFARALTNAAAMAPPTPRV